MARPFNRQSNFEKIPKAVLADVTRCMHLKQGTPVLKHIVFNKNWGMSMQKRQSMVANPKNHSYMKYNASRVILKINQKLKYPEEEEWITD